MNDFGAGVVGVAPSEGAGKVREHFSLTKICDAGSDLDESSVWAPIMESPPRRRGDIDDSAAYGEEMLRKGRDIVNRDRNVASEIVAFVLAALGAAETGELPNLLKANLPALFGQFPCGSLWLVTTDDVLLARLAFGRAQLAFELTPDLPGGDELESLRAFSDLTLTEGTDFSAIMNVPLLALSPSVLGFLVPALPHVLVFCFGADTDLRRPYPTSFSSLYRPAVLGDPEGLDRSSFLSNPRAEDGPELLEWWIERLNELYSHATDPTRFTTETGYHDPPAQTAWMITLERLIGDTISLLAEPQATDLDRVQISFDLLDKAENLLGYGRDKSGKGFAALLRRSECVPRLRDAFQSLPSELSVRIGDEVQRLFDELYSQVRRDTLSYRLTSGGARIARVDARELEAISDDRLVAALCRAVRNSSHGLQDVLRNHPDRFLLAANTGGIPGELAALAPLIALGMLADSQGLINGTWRSRLNGG